MTDMNPTNYPYSAVMNIAKGIAKRQSETQRISDIGGGVYTSDFFIPIIKPGEATTQVTFGVRFIEKPIMTYGFEMPPNQPLYPGAFPNGNVVVHQWLSGVRSDYGGRYYDGASLAILSLGAYNLSIIAHVRFSGKAVRNPAGQ